MDKADLETYQVQLSQVELALSADPENTELISLRSELKELIELTQAAIAQQEAAASSSKAEASKKASTSTASSSRVWAAGDECLAKYSGDGQWYPARIASVGGSAEKRVYSIVFKGYNNTELVNASQIKPLPPNYKVEMPASTKRKLSKEEEEERERKKRKNEKKIEAKAAKAKEQQEKQASWQKFAKKSEKKGIHIAGVSGTSIFKTPDNPLGKGMFLVGHCRLTTNLSPPYAVGVTGSGKGMTGVAPRTKHKFEIVDDPNA
ncbi:hypothetical protein BN946_scf184868.g51 [Trametes cinnabarina]|uniref:Tudor domain-containing protein n=1 Tax=Pycnoporus cinnabarinus TaxID=5643 RepID=A0A060SQ09_PYCCI|nr:hypothetical protein BN946_scf184868.g51 [Trametes cinnabarina]